MLYKTSLIKDLSGHGLLSHGNPSKNGEASHGAVASSAASGGLVVNGGGKVYNTNPVHESSPSSETLHRLNGSSSPLPLEGSNVEVEDSQGNNATSSSGQFNYSPSDFRFDQVMTYYHSDEFEAWLVGSIGWAGNYGIVDAETRSNQCYACTYPSSEDAFYSDGSGYSLSNPTREASVIAHEQMHIVSEPYNSLTQDFEANALDEGYSDFFAIAYRFDFGGVSSTELGEYVSLVGRDVDNTHQVDDFFSSDFSTRDITGNGIYSAHDGGIVLAGALWNVKQKLNDDVVLTAELALESLQYLDSDPSFMDARNAMVTAAGTGYPQHKCEIKDAFEVHNIGSRCGGGGNTAPLSPNNLQVTSQLPQDESYPVKLDWDPSPSGDVVEYNVYRCITPGQSSCSNWSLIITTSSTSATDYDYMFDGVDLGPQNDRAHYEVTAVDNGDLESDPSNETGAWVTPPSVQQADSNGF